MPTAAEAARTGALVVDEAERGTLAVTGRDRLTWLNGIVTCDVSKVAPGRGALGLILSKAGKVMSDLHIVADAERVYLSVAPGKHGELLEYFDRMLVMEDAEISDRTATHTWLGLHGPRAGEAAEVAAARTAGAAGSIDWTGLGGAALVVERGRRGDALEAMHARGLPLVLGTAEDWQLLRLERGVARYGVDYGLDDNPHEAALDQRAVAWNKGCYLGQEVVCMQGMRGKVKRRLVSLTLGGPDVPARGVPVVKVGDDTAVGEVTDARWSERLSLVVALARVQGAALEEHVPLTVGAVPASVVERPEP
ncbi:MAG: folate-binding protein YgfZ [Myxococcales bacterium]|nr:folate-binding protein YgfZ [Sorangiineae bacterium PRO1]MCL4754706.1 folate-binding protein YgfZ [Myxococcales bacterium]